ncbi:ROK family protein [Streptomyces sp. NPDC004726]
MNLPVLRGHNAALVLDLLRAGGEDGVSRLELAERTGLTPQAVSKITARLRAEGLAAEAGHRASTGGKPRTVLRLVPSAGHAIGLHLDRDELTVALLDLAGGLVAVRVAPLDLGAGAESVVEKAAAEVETLLSAAARARGPRAGADAVAEDGASNPFDTVGPFDTVASAGSAARSATGSVTGSAAEAGSVVGVGSVTEPDAEADADAEPDALWETGSLVAVRGGGTGTAPGGPVGVARVLGVGVAMPGPLDHSAGVTGRVTGFPEWDGYPLRDAVAARLGLPAVLDKDTNAAALGLALRSGRRGRDSFAYLHLGSGLGAGLVLGGGLYRGERTGAGEFGHQVVQLDGPPCGCGRRGCIEALCLEAVARGDIEAAARILGVGAANLVALLDIDRLLLGGRAVAAAGEIFVREAAARARVPVALAGGGPHLVAQGAAQLVLAPLFGRDAGAEISQKIR